MDSINNLCTSPLRYSDVSRCLRYKRPQRRGRLHAREHQTGEKGGEN